MTIVTEDAYVPTKANPTDPTRPDADSIELTPAERYVVEAGAFLAYAPLASKFTYDTGEAGVAAEDVGKVRSGLKVIAMSPEPRQTEYDYEATSATDFQPDAEGLYVFRRTIGVDDKTQIENYTYDAYYYVPRTGSTTKQVQYVGKTTDGANEGKYKWVNKNDDSDFSWTGTATAPSADYDPVMETVPVDGVDEHFYKISDLAVTAEKATFAGDQDQRDGIVSVATPPTYGFYKDVTKTVVPTLTYDKLNNRLVASYNTGVTKTNEQLRTLADKYEDAAIDYQDALEEYAAALGDEVGRAPTTLHTDADLAAATTDLRDAVNNLLAAEYARDAAKAAYDKAKAEADELEAAKTAAENEKNAANTALGSSDSNNTDTNTINGRYNVAAAALGESGDVWSDTKVDKNGTPDDPADDVDNNSAWAKENKAKAARDTALGDETSPAATSYRGAKAIREAAEQDERNAFLDLVVANATISTIAPEDTQAQKRAKAETYLNGLTYQQMVDLNIANPVASDPTAYSYYTKLINEKQAKEALDEAEAAYEQATRERKEAQRTYDIAKAAKEAAEAALGTPSDTITEYDPVTGANNTAVGRYNRLVRLYKEKMEQCYGLTTASANSNYGVNGNENDGYYDTNDYAETSGVQTGGSLFGTYKNKETAATNAQNTKNTKQGIYDNALAASNTAATNVTNAADRVAQTKQARDNAWNAYKTAYDATTGELKININLADVVTEGGVADKWQLLPESLEDVYKNDDTTTPGVNLITEATDGKTDTASFYYTSILGGGETSAKLIDSVELDPSVTKEMFKYFDFDLNITLNSAQVNIDENGNYTAETAQSELGKYAILTDNTSADTAITWSDTSTIPESAKAKKYQGTLTDATPTTYTDKEITELSSPMIFDYVDYNYVTVIDGKTYYGTGVGADAKFYKYDATTGTLLKANTDEVKDNVLTLGVAAKRKYTKTVTFKNTTDTTVADTTADYTYVEGGSWTGTAPTGASEFCATENGTYSTIQAALGSAADGTATVYYHTA